MKKKFAKVALAAAVVTVAGYGMYKNQPKETMSDVMLANLDALAYDETEIGPAPDGPRYTCVYGIKWGGVGIVRDCEGGCIWQYFVSDYDGTSSCYGKD